MVVKVLWFEKLWVVVVCIRRKKMRRRVGEGMGEGLWERVVVGWNRKEMGRVWVRWVLRGEVSC